MALPQTVQVLAPAKINLALHVTGQREDGYHLLDSLVGFTQLGDTLTVTAPGKGNLSASGAFGGQVPADRTNSVFKVADYAWPDMPMSFHLHKELPVASGIGGGSADAAACYRAISMLRRIVEADDGPLMMTEQRIAGLAKIGADIPMCVHSEAARVTGIGEEIIRLEDMPAMPTLLVNPGVSVSTPAVFKALEKRQNPAMGEIPRVPDVVSLVEWLSAQRNDLQDAAQSVFPQITSVLQALRRVQGCALARMSGSGATCFGLFSDKDALQAAAKRMKADHPDWWVRASVINGAVSSAPYRIRSTT